jgi:hypothetical protein
MVHHNGLLHLAAICHHDKYFVQCVSARSILLNHETVQSVDFVTPKQILIGSCTVGIEFLIQEKWGGSTQVVTLGQSLFIVGTAVGPAFMGPLS